ncbi:helix-turn-helix domain-containing protein [Nocardia brasiliensis]|uniref:helix-turn-helix domain-containing protein n=1 Tax=Nocardia brasiliensis TaxID=37326 RepID=UPI003D92FF2D
MPKHAERVADETTHRHGVPVLAKALRGYREQRGLSRAQIAARGYLSASLIEKWELEGRVPSLEKLNAWFDALDVPYCYRRKILELAHPDVAFVDHPDLVDSPTSSDLLLLEQVKTPSCYLSQTFDVLAMNAPLKQVFPGLDATPSHGGRTNLLEWMLLHPAARAIVRSNWSEHTRGMLASLRLLPPEVAGVQRYDEILAECSRAREFATMWAAAPPESEEVDSNFYLWCTDIEDVRHYRGRLHNLESPPRPFNWFVLLEVTPTASQVSPSR